MAEPGGMGPWPGGLWAWPRGSGGGVFSEREPGTDRDKIWGGHDGRLLAGVGCGSARGEAAPPFAVTWAGPGAGPGSCRLPAGWGVLSGGKTRVRNRAASLLPVFSQLYKIRKATFMHACMRHAYLIHTRARLCTFAQVPAGWDTWISSYACMDTWISFHTYLFVSLLCYPTGYMDIFMFWIPMLCIHGMFCRYEFVTYMVCLVATRGQCIRNWIVIHGMYPSNYLCLYV